MKKDIQIPEVSNVYVAVVNEYNDIYKTNDWNAYIVNDKEVDLDMVLIVAKGYSDSKVTSTMRHKLEKLPAKSYAKIELMQEWTYYIRLDIKLRDLGLQELTLNHEKKKQGLQSII